MLPDERDRFTFRRGRACAPRGAMLESPRAPRALQEPAMPRLPILAFAAAGLLAASAVHGGEVYQWKDANGVTHYSQTPPPAGSFQQRQITGTDRARSASPAAPVPAASGDPRCATARANLAALGSGRPVHEAGDDGQPGRALNDAERASQLELANAAIRAYCGGGAPATT